MESSIPTIEDECPQIHLTNAYQLQIDYENSIRKENFIVQEESARRLQLRIMLLEDENDELQNQLASEDERIDSLEEERDELQRQLEQAEVEARRHAGNLRTQTRELNQIKAELSSLNGLSTDATKLLTEKLALARELATLKPEIEHLRVQSAAHQIVLSEKLALERQLSTIEVELETEKRASKRATHKTHNTEKEEDLHTKLDALHKEVAKEKRERERLQKIAEKESLEWESRKGVLESKLEEFRTKLRSTKVQLKESQEELKKAQAATLHEGVGVATQDTVVPNVRKRNAAQMSTDATIGTPDGVAVRGKRTGMKRGKPDQTLLGEKSMFSITPYLNRTISAAPGTPPAEATVESMSSGKEEVEVGNGRTPLGKAKSMASTTEVVESSPTLKGKHKSQDAKKSVLQESEGGSANEKAIPRRQRAVMTLDKVIEEGTGVDENQVSLPDFEAIPVSKKEINQPALKLSSGFGDNADRKKKRRKLLGGGKTLFDEDDGDAPKRPTKVSLGPAKALNKNGARSTVLAGLGAASFGAFSPLKKDRRGANASFLA